MFILYNRVLHFLSGPYEEVTKGDTACGGTTTTGCNLIVTDPLDPLLVRLKIRATADSRSSVPIIIWQIWRFVTPGLHKHERRYAIGFLVSSIVLVPAGRVVAWFTVSKALEFLLGVGGSSIRPLIAADKYLTLVMLMFVGVRRRVRVPAAARVPAAGRGGEHRQLRHARRWAAVGITIFAAVITPSQDPFSLLFMAVPMYIFYEIAIVIGR